MTTGAGEEMTMVAGGSCTESSSTHPPQVPSAAVAGNALPALTSLSRAAGRLQPPLPPRQHAGRPCRRLLQRHSRLLFAGLPSVSREDLRKCIPAGNSGVAATVPPPAASAASPVRRPTSPPPLPAPERHPLPRPSHGVARISSERRRPRRLSLGLVGTHSGSPFRRASAPADVAISTSGIAAARSSSSSLPLHPSPSAVHRRRLRSFSSSTSRRSPGSSSRGAASVVVIAAACSAPSSSPCSHCRLPSSPPRRPRSSSSSSSSRCPHRRGVRPSVKPFAFVVRVPSSEPLQPRHRLRPRLRVVKPCAGRVSPSSKNRRRSRPLAVRLRRSRPSPPRPFVVVVPTPRRVVVRACSFACVLRVASVVPEVPEAWFAVVAEGSAGRSL
ncbi:uncharacterized protein [Oryza sativa Japonica Group]|uniref:uncharacterized protein n=1 Tax=Oryza sativa subsp. japonica TaxID=39947 RepID=UPI00339CCDA1